MHKRVAAILISLSIVLSSGVKVLADPSLQDQLTQSKNNVQAAQQKISELENTINSLDDQIGKKTEELKTIQNNIVEKQTEISQAEANIQKSEADIKAEQNLYNERMRAIYIDGNSTYISMLLDSSSFDDFISKMETITRITAYDKQLIDSLNQKEQAIKNQEASLQNDKQNLVSLQTQSESNIASLNQQKAAEQPLIAEANKEESSATGQVSALQSQIAEQAAEQLAAQKAAQQAAQQAAQSQSKNSNNNLVSVQPPNGNLVSSSATGAQVVAYAESFVGVHYVWGAEDPSSGFDCSGLVQYAYSHFGISLNRTSEDQYSEGVSVNLANLQPGDLLFYNWGEDGIAGPGHVTMYVGNGNMVEAPHTGLSVRITPVRDGIVGARRIIK